MLWNACWAILLTTACAHEAALRNAGPVTSLRKLKFLNEGRIVMARPLIKGELDAATEEDNTGIEKNVTKEQYDAAVTEEAIRGQHLYSFLLFAVTLTQLTMFMMVSGSNEEMVKNTWQVIDSFAIVVIASTMFTCIGLWFAENPFPAWTATFHVTYAVVLLLVSIYVSYFLRNQKQNLRCFNAIMYWVLLFAKGGAMTHAQGVIGQTFRNEILGTAVATLVVMVFFFVLMFITHWIKPEPGWYDDAETALAGGAVGAGICALVGMWIDNRQSPLADPARASTENYIYHKLWMIITVVAFLTVSPTLSKLKIENYWGARGIAFLNSVVGILPYFTVTIGNGAMACYLLGVDQTARIGRIASALTGSSWGLVMIYAVTHVPYLKNEKKGQMAFIADFVLAFGGYIAGYGWAAIYADASADLVVGDGTISQISQPGVLLLLNLFFIPAYVFYLAPIVTAKCYS